MVLELDPRVGQLLNRHGLGTRRRDGLGDLPDRHRLRHLVEDTELATVGRVLAGQLDAADGVADVVISVFGGKNSRPSPTGDSLYVWMAGQLLRNDTSMFVPPLGSIGITGGSEASAVRGRITDPRELL